MPTPSAPSLAEVDMTSSIVTRLVSSRRCQHSVSVPTRMVTPARPCPSQLLLPPVGVERGSHELDRGGYAVQLAGDGIARAPGRQSPNGETARIRAELPDPQADEIEDEVAMPRRPLREPRFELVARRVRRGLEPLRVVAAARADHRLAHRLVTAGTVDPGGQTERLLVGVGVAGAKCRLPEIDPVE